MQTTEASQEGAYMPRSCKQCKWLKKYTSDAGYWMNVCEAEEAEDQGGGLAFVSVIDTDEFDASSCPIFKEA
jgi:hypothetical protein